MWCDIMQSLRCEGYDIICGLCDVVVYIQFALLESLSKFYALLLDLLNFSLYNFITSGDWYSNECLE